MAEDLTVQLDDDTRLALSILTRDGASVTAAVRRALITAAGAG